MPVLLYRLPTSDVPLPGLPNCLHPTATFVPICTVRCTPLLVGWFVLRLTVSRRVHLGFGLHFGVAVQMSNGILATVSSTVGEFRVQSVYIETSVRNKCRCSFYCALLTLHVSAPIGGHLQVVCNTKNSKAVTVYINGSVASVCIKAKRSAQ
jgi:hypothetical protein